MIIIITKLRHWCQSLGDAVNGDSSRTYASYRDTYLTVIGPTYHNNDHNDDYIYK